MTSPLPLTTVEWGKLDDEIVVNTDGVTVYTGCHGCGSDTLTDRSKIERLRDALTDYLENLT